MLFWIFSRKISSLLTCHLSSSIWLFWADWWPLITLGPLWISVNLLFRDRTSLLEFGLLVICEWSSLSCDHLIKEIVISCCRGILRIKIRWFIIFFIFKRLLMKSVLRSLSWHNLIWAILWCIYVLIYFHSYIHLPVLHLLIDVCTAQLLALSPLTLYNILSILFLERVLFCDHLLRGLSPTTNPLLCNLVRWYHLLSLSKVILSIHFYYNKD